MTPRRVGRRTRNSQAGSATTIAAAPAISAQRLGKAFRQRGAAPLTVLDDFDLTVRGGELVAVVGPSGCGKSTLLRLLAGLEVPDRGVIDIGGHRPAELTGQHRLGIAFQDHALLPWLSARDNIALPWRVSGQPPDWSRIANLLELVGLAGFADARPRELSGGMRQRVSIARALALSPAVLLLDEPFGALDPVTRRRLNLELQRVWAATAATTVLVTHSVDEAVLLADRVLVMAGPPGRIVAEYPIPFDRPRQPTLTREAAFHALTDQLLATLDAAAVHDTAVDHAAVDHAAIAEAVDPAGPVAGPAAAPTPELHR